ncbi:hypothetical protein EVAR_40976_1 [Eumeta japonica]|uniref:Uncharacterized protein n=1 Tax=Eumeta variegata TaxID=151549 RepID=A0A4C1XEW1_EUMVA|nr:hypothetical protein EVAR_40976_1 [Eumeta japonica]
MRHKPNAQADRVSLLFRALARTLGSGGTRQRVMLFRACSQRSSIYKTLSSQNTSYILIYICRSANSRRLRAVRGMSARRTAKGPRRRLSPIAPPQGNQQMSRSRDRWSNSPNTRDAGIVRRRRETAAFLITRVYDAVQRTNLCRSVSPANDTIVKCVTVDAPRLSYGAPAGQSAGGRARTGENSYRNPLVHTFLEPIKAIPRREKGDSRLAIANGRYLTDEWTSETIDTGAYEKHKVFVTSRKEHTVTGPYFSSKVLDIEPSTPVQCGLGAVNDDRQRHDGRTPAEVVRDNVYQTAPPVRQPDV